MRIVITGGAGFIGANLARTLLDAGDEVVVVDDFSTGVRSNLDGLDVTLLEGTILDPDLLDKAMAGAESAVHLAALPSVPRSINDPVSSHHANATGTLEVLEAVRRADVPHVVVASSSSVYGANPELPKHEGLRTAPMSPYAVSKLATEAYALAFAHCYDLDVLAFRFFNVFGPLQPAGHAYAAVVPAFVDAAIHGRPLPVQGDGTQSRDFTYVGSLTRVVADAVHRRVSSPEPVNLAFGGRTTLRELIRLLETELGHEVGIETLPPRPGDVPHSQADSSRLLGLFPEVHPVALEEGLRATVAWFREIS
ncbi:MAG: NAD-dependent epimerase/dehydratase family protein [Actinomycetota bacterium]|nr:NAD-dependent epimerase/dehydratase family protein [Actinomycetota bacterium]